MADEQEQFGVKFQATTESVTQAKENFQDLTDGMEKTSEAGKTSRSRPRRLTTR